MIRTGPASAIAAVTVGVLCLAAPSRGAARLMSGMVRIAEGSYQPVYGTTPRHVDTFEIDAAPVTTGEYLAFVRANPAWQRSRASRLFVDEAYLRHWTSDLDPGPDAPLDAPVVSVSWFAARAYVKAQRKQLPTVDQWEYVASLRRAHGIAGLHGGMQEWTLDFNAALVGGDARDSSVDRGLYCGGAALGLLRTADGAALQRLVFRASLDARYSVANLGFRGARTIVKEQP